MKASVAIIEQIDPVKGAAILLMKRVEHPNDPWSGHWSFPGGKIEPNESPLAASIRETFEEVGIELSQDLLTEELEIAFAGKSIGNQVPVHPFVFSYPNEVKLTQLKLELLEVEQVQWIYKNEFEIKANHKLYSPIASQPTLMFTGYDMCTPMPLWGFTYELLKKYWTVSLD